MSSEDGEDELLAPNAREIGSNSSSGLAFLRTKGCGANLHRSRLEPCEASSSNRCLFRPSATCSNLFQNYMRTQRAYHLLIWRTCFSLKRAHIATQDKLI